MLGVVWRREALALFRAPFAWVVLAVVQFLVAYQFLAQVDLFVQYLPRIRSMPQPPGVAQLVVAPTFGVTAFLLLLLIPMLTMQTFAGERRAGTLRLWYSAPLSLPTLVLGKFLGVLSLLAVIWGLNALMPLTLLWGTPLDLGTYAGGLIGLAALMTAGTAIGLFCSASTSQPALAAIASFAVLLTLWLIDWASQLDQAPGLLARVSLLGRFQHLSSGVVDTSDLTYFAALTIAALALTWWRLQGERDAL
jgi:ABC-2 type transport system permease protein